MEIIIKDKKENDLLERTEILAIIKSEITPRMQDATKALAEYLRADAGLVIIRRMKGKFGRKEFEVEACIYESREAMQKIEPKPKVKKQEERPEQEGEKAPQAEKKAEEKKDEKSAQTEKKAEEKKEEKAEEKTEPTAK